jgi:GT2 family glycosyltransferase/nucleoside phosphorylase
MIVICIALEQELCSTFKSTYPGSWVRFKALQSGAWHRYQKQPFLVVITGVGHRVIPAIQWIIQTICPTEVINIGTAGSPQIPIGSWTLLKTTAYKNNSVHMTMRTGLPIPYATFTVADGVTVDAVSGHTDARVYDMEAYFIANACYDAEIPVCSVKYITDTTLPPLRFDEELPRAQQAIGELLMHLVLPEPSIDVIIPTYNRHQKTRNAIDSVCNQTHAPQRIIVVDDGSDTPFEDDRCEVIRHPHNRGVSTARNTGIQHSNAQWVAFLDSDDVWEPHHLDGMVAYLNHHPLCRILQSQEKWVRNNRHLNPKKYHTKPVGWAFEPSLERCLVSPSGVMIHRRLLDWYGLFDPYLWVCEDYDLWLRLLRFVPIGRVDRVSLVKYGGHSDQLSQYPLMDAFRIVALAKQWQNAFPNINHHQLKDYLLHKLAILRGGAHKRNRPTGPYDQLRDHILKNDQWNMALFYTVIRDSRQ